MSKSQRDNCITCTFSCKQFSHLFVSNFGTDCQNKKIPEWAKKIDDIYKAQLILGYLHSDGCVNFNPKSEYYGLEFVSINLELLEDFQDIAFSLGLISNLNKLRNESTQTFKGGRTYKTKECYHLRFGHISTLKFKNIINNEEDLKLSKIKSNKIVRKKPLKDCFLSSDLKYIYFQVKNIKKIQFTGKVYNFECETNTFICKNIPTHNCDPYNTDQTKTSDSLGSIYVMRRQNTNVGEDVFQDVMVASYTGRPAKLDDFHTNVMYLLEYYNSTVLNEASNSTFVQFFDNKQKGNYVEDAVQLQKEINPNSQAMNMKGLAATPRNKQYRQDLIIKYLYEEETTEGKPGYTRVLDPILCMELLGFNPDNKKGNYDRIDAFGHALTHLYKEKKYRPIVDINYEEKIEKQEIKKRPNAFGFPNTSVSLQSNKNPFNL